MRPALLGLLLLAFAPPAAHAGKGLRDATAKARQFATVPMRSWMNQVRTIRVGSQELVFHDGTRFRWWTRRAVDDPTLPDSIYTVTTPTRRGSTARTFERRGADVRHTNTVLELEIFPRYSGAP